MKTNLPTSILDFICQRVGVGELNRWWLDCNSFKETNLLNILMTTDTVVKKARSVLAATVINVTLTNKVFLKGLNHSWANTFGSPFFQGITFRICNGTWLQKNYEIVLAASIVYLDRLFYWIWWQIWCSEGQSWPGWCFKFILSVLYLQQFNTI